VRRNRHGGLLVAALVGMVLSASPFACSSSAQLQGAGGACVLATDCQDGFICCNGDKGSNTCVASAACLQPAGAEGDAAGTMMMTPQGDGAGGDDMTMATPPGTDASQQDNDTGTTTEPPDTGTTKPMDSGKPEDTGTPQQEAAPPPPQDSGGGADAPSGD
jgi:hypothetical protein